MGDEKTPESRAIGLGEYLVKLFKVMGRAWRRGWWVTPWKMPRQAKDEAILEGLGEYLSKEPEVKQSLRQLRLRDESVRNASTTILLLDVLLVAGAIAAPFLHHPERSWIGIFVGFGMFSLAASFVGLHRMREYVFPSTEIRLHGWAQVVGLLMTLAYIGWTIAWFA